MTRTTAVRALPISGAVLLAAALGCLLALVAAASAHAGPGHHEGLDVSNHQGRIQWRVVPDSQRFVFAKASEGTTFVDAFYERNRRGAERSGRLVGAYHFAQPAGLTKEEARSNGRSEARFFHRVAAPQAGELRPVLDIEVTNGLTPELLKPWAKAFVKALHRRVGAKPMIYSTPHFWRNAMDNTEWFAERGYRALWIAHWQAEAPHVPAHDWNGQGWTFWQFTNCGIVKGIAGCVDQNKYRYQRFGRVTIKG